MGAILDLVKSEVRTAFINNHLDLHVWGGANIEVHKASVMHKFDKELNEAQSYMELINVVRHWWTSFNSTQNTTEQAEAVLKAIISIK